MMTVKKRSEMTLVYRMQSDEPANGGVAAFIRGGEEDKNSINLLVVGKSIQPSDDQSQCVSGVGRSRRSSRIHKIC